MGYEMADGFDNYGNAFNFVASPSPWDFANNNVLSSTADFRFSPPVGLSGGCVTISGSGNVLRKNLSGNRQTLFIGVAFKLTTLPNSGAIDILDFWDNGNCQGSLAVLSTGALQFYRANGNPIGGSFNSLFVALATPSASALIQAGQWYGLGVQITFGNGSGSAAAFLNGGLNPALSISAVNNIGTANAFANQVSLGVPGVGGFTCKYDDFYCFNTSGPSLNSLVAGDARIITKMPASAGTYTNWTHNGLATNWQNAAVQPPNVADFNSNNTPGTKDSYTPQSAGLQLPPIFVMVRASLTRDDAGPHTPSLFMRNGGVDSAGVVTPALSASYGFYDALFLNDPATGFPFQPAAADAAEPGIIEG